jgi:Regulator of chromosome condensation (RCC1) repeat
MKLNSAVSGAWLVLAALPLAGCGGAEPGDSGESVGQAEFQLTTVPTGAQCLQVVGSAGVTFSATAALTAGASSTSVSLGRLPLGSGTINASVFDVACSALAGATPSWIADSQSATFRPGVITTLTLNLRANNPVVASANFVGNIVSMSAGYDASGLVLSDGSVRLAGNWSPLPGGGSVFAKPTALTGVLEIAAPHIYNGHSCARTASQVLCWGSNLYGQLGTGVALGSTISTPTGIVGLPIASAISVGHYHTCAISNGSAYCLGYNGYGELGNGTTTNSATPGIIGLPQATDLVSAGSYHTCANTYGGLYCWGYNGSGQLGDGTTTSRPSPSYVSGGEGTVSLVAGDSHSCAVRADGTVRCWGYNGYGQLGDGTTTQRLTPTQVVGITDAVQVALGWDHSCFLRANGTVLCSGMGSYGQIGDGTAQARSTPTQVPGLTNVVSITGGSFHTCAKLDDQRIFCWGEDGSGSAGDGSPGNNYKPIAAIIQ